MDQSDAASHTISHELTLASFHFAFKEDETIVQSFLRAMRGFIDSLPCLGCCQNKEKAEKEYTIVQGPKI